MKKIVVTAIAAAFALSICSLGVFAQDTAAEGSGKLQIRARAELTEEQKAEMLEKMKEKLASQLSDGAITQEEYDEAIAAIESGEMPKIGERCDRGAKGNIAMPEADRKSMPPQADKQNFMGRQSGMRNILGRESAISQQQ